MILLLGESTECSSNSPLRDGISYNLGHRRGIKPMEDHDDGDDAEEKKEEEAKIEEVETEEEVERGEAKKEVTST